MKFALMMAGAVLTFGAVGVTAHAAPQGAIVLAEDDHDKGQHSQPGNKGAPPGNKGVGAPVIHNNMMMMGGPNDKHDHKSNQNSMGGQNQMGGHNQMGGPNLKGGQKHYNFDVKVFQKNFTAPKHFHIGSYHRPHGWYAHRWVYGDILPAFFWTNDYWISDYSDYDLADPPDGFVWVRDGDDALLVDTDSGQVLQVEYGVFD